AVELLLLERGVQLRAEADAPPADAGGDDVLDAGEGSRHDEQHVGGVDLDELLVRVLAPALRGHRGDRALDDLQDRKSTRLNSSHVSISYAVFCLKKKKK